MTDSRARWPVRECLYCREEFRKAPTYATCGHPRCVRTHRALAAQRRSDKRHMAGEFKLGWDAPNPYAADTSTRTKIWSMLKAYHTQDSLDPRAVQTVAIQAKVRPAEVYQVWVSMKKESENA